MIDKVGSKIVTLNRQMCSYIASSCALVRDYHRKVFCGLVAWTHFFSVDIFIPGLGNFTGMHG